jgi:arabinoxylan arabinofuranohydrolase
MRRQSCFRHCLWLGLLASAGWVSAGNPLVPGKGISDPHITVHGDRAYLFAGHDPELNDWWVWSSGDLVNWRLESTLDPKTTFTTPWCAAVDPARHACWASFGTFKNDQVYWYVSAGPTAVLVADSPAGPWKDPLGKPLIPDGLTTTAQYDPDILIDDDGKAYMIFGCYDYFIVRLNEDMISLAEKPRPVQFDRKFGPYGFDRNDDKPSLHKRNGIYYLSWCSFYAMSRDLYGPYVFKGSVIVPEVVAPDFHPVDVDIWYDRHGNFFTWHNQWYYICHDFSQPERRGREACISYVHFREDGTMAPVRLDKVGVGEYDAARTIEAEDYFAADGADIRERPAGGFEVRNLRKGSYLVYPKVRNVRQNASVTFCLSSKTGGGMIQVREKGPEGTLLGSCKIPSTQDRWDVYNPVICGLEIAPGTKDICLVFKDGAEEMVRLDWFKFR